MILFKCVFGYSYYYNKFVFLWYILVVYKVRYSLVKIFMVRLNKFDFVLKLLRGIYFI